MADISGEVKSAIVPLIKERSQDPMELSMSTGYSLPVVMAILRSLPEAEEIEGELWAWNPQDFGNTRFKAEDDGQLTIFYDNSAEPPDPDDYSSLDAFEIAWDEWRSHETDESEEELQLIDASDIWQQNIDEKEVLWTNSDNSTCAPESARDLQSPDNTSATFSLSDSARKTNGVRTSSENDFQKLESTQISAETGNYRIAAPISSPAALPANHSHCKEIGEEEPTREIASQKCSTQLPHSGQNFSSWRTSPEYLVANSGPNPIACTLTGCSQAFAKSGTSTNGIPSAREISAGPSKEEGYFWLDSPGALSCGLRECPNGQLKETRPPGQMKMETHLKSLGILAKGEVCNPAILENLYGLPLGWTNPSECRAVTELLVKEERLWETHSIPQSPRSPSEESGCSTTSHRERSTSLKRTYTKGGGSIKWRITNKGRKSPNQQLYFEWKLGNQRGCTYVRSHLKKLVVEMNNEKRPVIEILAHLDYDPRVKEFLSNG